MISRGICVGLLGLAVLANAGCGKKQFGEVYGTVSFQGKPVTEGRVLVADEEWGTFRTAQIQSDGTYRFRVTKDDGLPLKGEYQVAVLPALPDPPVGIVKTAKPVKSNIPAHYQDPKKSGLGPFTLETSGMKFDIEMK